MTGVNEAIRLADWHARYAIDRLDDSDHPGVKSHLTAAHVQLQAAQQLAIPAEISEA